MKIGLFVFWAACIFGLYWYLHAHGIRLRRLPSVIRGEIAEAGAWGPLLIVGLYVASTILVFTKGSVDIIAGAIYGPLLGSVFVLIGLNLAAMVTFAFGRYFGGRFVAAHEKGWIKKYDDLFFEEGFMTVLLMRLLMLPFDLVSIACGASRISFRQFAVATFFGSIPVTITLVALGGSLGHPRERLLLALVYALTIIIAFFMRRLPWIRRRLYKEVAPIIK